MKRKQPAVASPPVARTVPPAAKKARIAVSRQSAARMELPAVASPPAAKKARQSLRTRNLSWQAFPETSGRCQIAKQLAEFKVTNRRWWADVGQLLQRIRPAVEPIQRPAIANR